MADVVLFVFNGKCPHCTHIATRYILTDMISSCASSLVLKFTRCDFATSSPRAKNGILHLVEAATLTVLYLIMHFQVYGGGGIGVQ